MGDGFLFVILLAMTIGTVGVVLVQVVFGLMEVKKRRLQERLGAAPEANYESQYGSLTLDKPQDLTGMLARSPAMLAFQAKLRKAYPGVVLKKFFTMIICFAVLAAIASYVLMQSPVAAVFGGAMAAMLPFLIVGSKCAKHQRIVEDQLPEALDFLARVLKAGHSLATGLQMAGDEIPEPLASEFRRCYDQHSLGAHIEAAMKEMADRVATPDFSFFVTAVLIQRTTGGDLAEVLTNIGNMVRSRIRLRQQVKAITAQGRMVGYSLVVLPFLFYACLYVINTRYARVLLDTRVGFELLCGAIVSQVLGLYFIRRIVTVQM
jgi:tight adherence protein B